MKANTNSEKYRPKLIPQKRRGRSIKIVQPFWQMV